MRGQEQLSDTDPKYLAAYFHDEGPLTIKQIIIDPQYDWPKKDLAIVKLQAAVPDIAPVSLNKSGPVKTGTLGWIVGFGIHGPFKNGKFQAGGPILGSQGLKLWSTIKTGNCSKAHAKDDLICWKYELSLGDQLLGTTCEGDSGGPLFAEIGSDWRLVGVTSGGPINCQPVSKGRVSTAEAFDVDIFANVSWIMSAAGMTPQQGPAASILVDPKLRAAGVGYHEFMNLPDHWNSDVVLGSGLKALRVSINTTPTFSSLQLEVFAPGATNPECSTSTTDSFATCTAVAPTAGTWTVSVTGARPQESQLVGTVLK